MLEVMRVLYVVREVDTVSSTRLDQNAANTECGSVHTVDLEYAKDVPCSIILQGLNEIPIL